MAVFADAFLRILCREADAAHLIFSSSDHFQVTGAYTEGIAAEVIGFKSFWQIPISKEICHAVRQCGCAEEPKFAIPCTLLSGCP